MVTLGSEWLAYARKTPKGKGTAGKEVALRPWLTSGGARAGLWRGAKGQARIPSKNELSWIVDRAKTSWTSVIAKVVEGAKKPIRSLTRSMIILGRPSQPHERHGDLATGT